jgi:hypothetical protein
VASVTVAVVGSRVDAELIVGMLRNHGIPAVVSADDAGGVELALQAQGVRVLVPESNASAARRLLGDSQATGRLNILQRWLVRLLGGGQGSGTSGRAKR